MTIRDEQPRDGQAIREIVAQAFKGHAHSSQTEHLIVEALRADGAMTVSLVADAGDGIVGHVAFSPITIDGMQHGWHGLGPVAVRPDRQKRGIGQALIRAGLERLRGLGSKGCVLVGDPAYYVRFGFRADPRLRFDGVPPEYFLVLPFGGETPHGVVQYHPAFTAIG